MGGQCRASVLGQDRCGDSDGSHNHITNDDQSIVKNVHPGSADDTELVSAAAYSGVTEHD